MSKVALSVVVATLLLGTVVVGAVSLLEKTNSPPIVAPAVDLSELRAGLEKIRDEIASLRKEVTTLRGIQESAQLAQALSATTAAGPTEGGQAAAPQPTQFKAVVAAVLEEQRRVEEEERQRAREEREKRMEERRQEFEALSEGPYDRYNLKVNSLGSVLNMNDAQKQTYYNLITAYNTKLEESRRAIRAIREQSESAREGAEGEGEDGGRRRRRGGRDFEQFRELSQSIQAEFDADMRSILNSAQYEIYEGLSRDAKSFQSAGMVSADGDDDRRGFTSRFGGGPGGGGGAGFGGGGGFGGGRGGGRGGRGR